MTLWTRSNERQWRGEQERKNKHIQQWTLRNGEREKAVIIHLNSIATQHIPQSYQFTYSHSLLVLLHMWCWRQNTVCHSLFAFVWNAFCDLKSFKNSIGTRAMAHTHTQQQNSINVQVCVCIIQYSIDASSMNRILYQTIWTKEWVSVV